jgi:hypothetical protein
MRPLMQATAMANFHLTKADSSLESQSILVFVTFRPKFYVSVFPFSPIYVFLTSYTCANIYFLAQLVMPKLCLSLFFVKTYKAFSVYKYGEITLVANIVN